MDAAELGTLVKKVVGGLFLVPAGPLFAIFVGLALVPRRPRTGLALIALAATLLFALAMPIVAYRIEAPVERAYPPLDAATPIPPNTAIVVLGGGLQMGAKDYGGETVNAVTLVRVRSAARLAARTHLPILVTGGRPWRAQSSEAEHMADALTRDFRTPVRWVEKESRDTYDNARMSAPLLKASRIEHVLLVTDAQHMPRASQLFEAQGLQVLAAPTDYYADEPVGVLSFIPNTLALRRSSWSVYEWVGLLWSRIREH